jgi:dethiobiotin synthetase
LLVVRGLLVTGTDTDVGKTVLAAALLAAIASEGEPVRAHKPVITGVEPDGGDRRAAWPDDDELLGSLAGMTREVVAPLRYRPAVSPHLAAALAGGRIDPARLLRAAAAGAHGPAVIVEGVGGLLTPLAEAYTVRDFAAALGLPVVIAARPGLGTINHTLLTLEAARNAGLDVRAVVLTPWPRRPRTLERSNRETIARLGMIPVEVLPRVARAEPAALARAGGTLPWREWLGRCPAGRIAAARMGAPDGARTRAA